MVPLHYLGIWRRDWIDRFDKHGTTTRELQPAIWFQSLHYHVDLRIDPQLTNLPASLHADVLAQTQIAFAGSTDVTASDQREICRWHPRIAYPRLTDEVDAGFMHFESATHLMEHGIDSSYKESWRRLNHDDDEIHCLRFSSISESQKECFLMLCGAYFALGSNYPDAGNLQLPVYAWGERHDNEWIVRESLAPWNIERLINIDQALFRMTTLESSKVERTLPLMPDSRWHLVEID